ncbi:PRC-barrel domain-containing protein [Tumebacillus lipolyticus]|uniref:PRC-barrel domain-containing protein n=1 Tax=Tumebacillus lipolyticus TaxID=1280370 RepID=A0ABW4ZTC6_9BACL
MRRARDLIGLPVVELTGGEHVGEVRDVLFSSDGGVHSLLLAKGTMLSASKIVPKEKLHGVGQDAVTIEKQDAIEEFRDETGLVRSLIQGDVQMVGKEVLTQDGNYLGTVADVYLDQELYTIAGYEVSEGFLTDLKEGRKVLPAHPAIMVGQDTLLVPTDTELAEEL